MEALLAADENSACKVIIITGNTNEISFITRLLLIISDHTQARASILPVGMIKTISWIRQCSRGNTYSGIAELRSHALLAMDLNLNEGLYFLGTT